MYNCRKKTEKPPHYLKGKVTKVNQELLCFAVETNDTIFVDISKPHPEFPCEGDEIEIKNLKKYCVETFTGVIGELTVLKYPVCQNASDPKILEFFTFLKEKMVDADELIAMNRRIRKLKLYYNEKLIPNCLKILLENSPHKTIGLQTFCKTQIKVPTNLTKYVNKNADLYHSFLKFEDMCAYGVYPNKTINKLTDSTCEYLFGFLVVDQNYGWFILKDKKSKIPVIFFHRIDSNLHKYANKMVMIKKWTVITEMFEEKNTSSLKYVLFDSRDVVIVENIEKDCEEKLFYSKDEAVNVEPRRELLICVNKKTESIVGYEYSPECWLEAEILDYYRETYLYNGRKTVFFIIGYEHMSILPFLKENCCYHLYFKDRIVAYRTFDNKELYGLRTNYELGRLNKDTIFQEVDFSQSMSLGPLNQCAMRHFDNFAELKSYIQINQSNKPISVTLTIAKKTLQDNSRFQSFIQNRTRNAAMYGPPGTKKQMKLIFYDKESQCFIDVFLTNRDNHVMPLGLIKDVRVKIGNVVVYKNKYLKTTVFTTFEILEYCPPVSFSSVSLYFTAFDQWIWQDKTQETLLGLYSQLPLNCIIQGTFWLQALFDLKIVAVCEKCKNPLENKKCLHCCNSGFDLAVEMCVVIMDSCRSFVKLEADKNFFCAAILGLRREEEVKYVIEYFANNGHRVFDFCKTSENACNSNDEIATELIDLVKNYSNKNVFLMVTGLFIRQDNFIKPFKMLDFFIKR